MSDNCLYCNKSLDHEGFSVCETCGEKIWGRKMYDTIKNNMSKSPLEEESTE